MAQGKQWNKVKVLKVLEPYFKLGCSITKACAYAGIAEENVYNWIRNDPVLLVKIKAWQNWPNTKARENWVEAIRQGDTDKSIEWLQYKEKDEFTPRTETLNAQIDLNQLLSGLNRNDNDITRELTTLKVPTLASGTSVQDQGQTGELNNVKTKSNPETVHSGSGHPQTE